MSDERCPFCGGERIPGEIINRMACAECRARDARDFMTPAEIRFAEKTALATQLAALLSKHSCENESNTPDFILAAYMLDCLEAFERASKRREAWYGTKHELKE